MPVYEYICPNCHRRTDILSRTFQPPSNPTCSHCGGQDLKRAITTFAFHKSEKTRQEEAGDPDKAGPDYFEDPRNIGLSTEERFQEMGLDMPDDLQEKIGEAQQGEVNDLLEPYSP